MPFSSSRPLSRPRTIMLATIFAGAMVSGAWMLQRGTGKVVPPVQGGRLFDIVRERIATQYVDTFSEAQLYRMALDGVMQELSDPYSAFLPTGSAYAGYRSVHRGIIRASAWRSTFADGFLTVVNPSLRALQSAPVL